MTQPFRLQTILNLRKQERDRLSLAVSMARAKLLARAKEQSRIALFRQDQLNELRRLNESMDWNIGQIMDRQSHLDHLRQELQTANDLVAESEAQLMTTMSLFTAAEQAFRGLERLAEKHAQTEATDLAKASAADLDDLAMSRWRRTDV